MFITMFLETSVKVEYIVFNIFVLLFFHTFVLIDTFMNIEREKGSHLYCIFHVTQSALQTRTQLSF